VNLFIEQAVIAMSDNVTMYITLYSGLSFVVARLLLWVKKEGRQVHCCP
jgi:hypothetical protein